MAGEPSGGGGGGGGGKMIFIFLFICFCCCCLSSLAAGGGWYTGKGPFASNAEAPSTTSTNVTGTTLAPEGSTNIAVPPPPGFTPPITTPPVPPPAPPPPTATTRDGLIASGQAIAVNETEVGTDSINSSFETAPTGYNSGEPIAMTVSFDVCIEQAESVGDRCFFAHNETTLAPAFLITNSRATIGGNRIMVTANAYDNIVSSIGLTVGPSTWYTVTVVIANGNMNLYINGTADNSMSGGSWTWPGDSDPGWKWAPSGAAGAVASPSSIKIKNFYFWPAPLTATQVKLLPASGATWTKGTLKLSKALGSRDVDVALTKFTKMDNTSFTGTDIVWSTADRAKAASITFEGDCALRCTTNTSCKSFIWDAAASGEAKCVGRTNRGDGQTTTQGKTLYSLKSEGAPRSGTDAGAAYTSLAGAELFSFDITSAAASSATTVFACSTACDAEPTCNSFVFDTVMNQCGLKSNRGDGYSLVANRTLYYKTASGVPRSAADILATYTEVPGNDLNGFDNGFPRGPGGTVDGHYVGTTPGQCAALCDANTSCLSFVYDNLNYNCWLKHTKGDGYFPVGTRSLWYKTSVGGTQTTAPVSGSTSLGLFKALANTSVTLNDPASAGAVPKSLLGLPTQTIRSSIGAVSVQVAWPTPGNAIDCAVACVNSRTPCKGFLWDPMGTPMCKLSSTASGDSVATTGNDVKSTWYYKTGESGPVAPAKFVGIGKDNELYYKSTVDADWIIIPSSGGIQHISQDYDGSLLGIDSEGKPVKKTSLDPNSIWTRIRMQDPNWRFTAIVPQWRSGNYLLESADGRAWWMEWYPQRGVMDGQLNNGRTKFGNWCCMKNGAYALSYDKQKILGMNEENTLWIKEWKWWTNDNWGPDSNKKKRFDFNISSICEYEQDRFLIVKDDDGSIYKQIGFTSPPVQTNDTIPMKRIASLHVVLNPPPNPASGTSTYTVEPRTISRGISYFKREPLWSRSDRGSVQPMNSDSDGFASW